jgi:RNA polymerase sigma-70 factor (ECF subfamily)
LQNIAHAEDAVQETLLSALESRTHYAGRASEKTWLTAILKRKIIDCIRKQVRETTTEDITLLSDLVDENDIDDLFDQRGRWIHPPQDWGNPQKMLNNSQFLDAFEHCYGKLKPTVARVFSLKEMSGSTTEEICNALSLTTTNFSVILYRARMSLRRCLDIRWSGGNNKELE